MGLPGAGKSTLAKRVENELRERKFEPENLDGDEIRKNLHPDLGFSKEDRAINNRRTAFVAKLLIRNNIPVIAAMITPFRDAQQQAREIIESEGRFIQIYVKCPVEVCEERDPKGLYEQAHAGKIDKFTGVNHPFQEPLNPEIVVDTSVNDIEECTKHIIDRLEEEEVLTETLSDEYDFDVTVREEQEIKERLVEMGHLQDDER
jgi:adenylylsulfate kinase